MTQKDLFASVVFQTIFVVMLFLDATRTSPTITYPDPPYRLPHIVPEW